MAPSNLSDSLSKNPTNHDMWRSEAWSLLEKGDIHRSKLVLETLVHAAPQDLQAHLLLTDACLQLTSLGSKEEAVSTARHAHQASVKEKNGEALCGLGLAVALGSLARQQQLSHSMKQKHRAEAIQLLQSLLCSSAASVPHAALLQYNLAVLLAEAGQLGPAIEHARVALQACSGAAEVAVTVLASDAGSSSRQQQRQQQLLTLCLVLLALLLSARQQHQAALQLLTAAPSSSTSGSGTADSPGATPPPRSDVLVARLRAQLLHSHVGDTAAAMAVLAQVKKRMAAPGQQAGGKPSVQPLSATAQPQVWQDLALLCAASGSHDDARFCADQALQLCPWEPRSHQVLGQVELAAGQFAEASQSYNTALALEPCHAPTLLSLGTMYRQRGGAAGLALAQDLLSESLRYDATSPAAWYELGLACRGLGHRVEAEEKLRTAVGLAAVSPTLSFSECPLLLRV